MTYEQWLEAYMAEKARIEGQLTNVAAKQRRAAQREAAAKRLRLDKFRASESKRKEVHESRDLERELKEYNRETFGA